MRKVIKQLLAGAVYYSGLLALIDYCALTFALRSHSVLLMYHRVLDDPFSEREYAQTGTAVSTQSFRAQIAFLAKEFTVVSAGDYIEKLRTGQTLPQKCAVITFDDGWADNFENAYSILKQYNVPATIFVCTDFVNTTRKFWFHELLHSVKWQKLSSEQLARTLERYHPRTSMEPMKSLSSSDSNSTDELIDEFFQLAKALDAEQLENLTSDLIRLGRSTDESWEQRRFILNWAEISAMDQSIIEIGSHGKSHRLLTSISSDEVFRELNESKQQIEQTLKRNVRTFAYPNGSYDENIKRMTSDAGYSGAFAVGSATTGSDLFAISRTGVHEGATTGFRGRFSRAMWALALSPAKRVWFDRWVSSSGKRSQQNHSCEIP